MGWFDSMAAGAAKTAQAAQQQFPNSYGIDPNQTVMGVPIGQMLQQYNQSQQQQTNPWGATPATPNAVQSGSLAALGGGVGRNAPIYNPVQPPQSGPQPVPGMPPQQMMPQPPQQGNRIDPTTGQPLSDQDITNTQQRLAELQKDDWKYPVPFAGSNPNDPRTSEMNILSQRLYGSGAMPMPQMQKIGDVLGNRGSGQPINQPMGSLQSLGGGPIAATVGNALNGVGSSPNMSGPIGSVVSNAVNQAMVNLRGPDGSTKAVPQSDLAHWLSRGAQQIQGAF
jgi:hypothetical protein